MEGETRVNKWSEKKERRQARVRERKWQWLG